MKDNHDAGSTHNDPSQHFDHEFSGWSVWVEPCEEASKKLRIEMRDLANRCGGESRGVHDFTPHCTLLYNTDAICNSMKILDDEEKCGKINSIGSLGEELLKNCLVKYKMEIERQNQKQESSATTDVENEKKREIAFDLIPTSLFYFPYPKSADEGRGFGCVILLLLLENEPEGSLHLLHNAVTSIFPPDERHGDAGGKFTPHMSLVYAPESETWLENELEFIKSNGSKTFLLDSLPGKYLSLWRTQGKMSEWYKAAQVEIS